MFFSIKNLIFQTKKCRRLKTPAFMKKYGCDFLSVLHYKEEFIFYTKQGNEF